MTRAVTRLTPTAEVRSTQGALALDLNRTAPALPETPELDPLRHSRVEQVAEAEVRAWAARLAQAVVEVVAGRRPASQLVRWTTPAVQRDLERRARAVARVAGLPSPASRATGQVLGRPRATASRAPLHPQVRSVHVSRPGHDVAEVSVHVRFAQRSRALAMRLEHRQERWLCTVLELG